MEVKKEGISKGDHELEAQVSATSASNLHLPETTTKNGLGRNSEVGLVNESAYPTPEEQLSETNGGAFEVLDREQMTDSLAEETKEQEPLITNKQDQSAYNYEKLDFFEKNITEWYENTGVTSVTLTFFEGHIRVLAPHHLEHLERNAQFKELFLKALASSPSNSGRNKMNVITQKTEEDSEEDTPVPCDKCNKTFTKNSQLQKHKLLIHLPKEVSEHRCDKCGKVFQAAAFLQTHLCNRTGQRHHECTVCGTRFTSVSSLKMHLRIHSAEKPFKCETCGKGFPRKSSLNYHLTKHTGEKDYQCRTCGKEFALLNNLKDHERIHSGERPFSCQECGKSFTVSSTLRRHLLIHSGEKPFPCKICKSRFTRLIHLQSHLRVHSGEKPFKCNECNKKFAQSSHLKRHQKIHERDKNQLCDKCGQEFKYKERSQHRCPPQNPVNPLRQLTFPYNFVHA